MGSCIGNKKEIRQSIIELQIVFRHSGTSTKTKMEDFPSGETIFKGNDRRVKVTLDKFSQFPFNSIGWIESKQKFPTQVATSGLPLRAYSTGFLISSNLVITSSHNFVVRDQQNSQIKEYEPISFTLFEPGSKKDELPEEIKIGIQNVKINTKFIQITSSIIIYKNLFQNASDAKLKLQYKDKILELQLKAIQHDFALIKLSTPFDRSQYFELTPGLQEKMELVVTGCINFYGTQFRLLTHSNEFQSIVGKGIFYDIDSAGGQSGAPVYLRKDSRKLVGIHKASWPMKKLNCATLITEFVVEVLQKWANEMNSSLKRLQKNSQQRIPVSTGQKQAIIVHSLIQQIQEPPQMNLDQRSMDPQIQSQSQIDTFQKARKLRNKGKQFYNKDQFQRAIQRYNQALSIYEKLNCAQSSEYAKTLSNIGLVYKNEGKLDKALQYLNKALIMYQKVKGIESFECAAIINNIGLVYRNQGKLNQSIEQYAKALSIYERLKGMESLECAATLNNIGLVHQKQGRLNQALEYQCNALNIYQKIKGVDSFECSATLNNIGSVYRNQGQLKQALQFYQRSLNIKQSVNGKESFECAATLNNIGKVCKDQGKLDKALEYYDRALSIYEKVKKEESLDCLATLNNISNVYEDQGKLNQAIDCYSRAQGICQKYGFTKSKIYATILRNIEIYKKLNDDKQKLNSK